MKWSQLIDPLNNMFVSALVVALPIMVIFWAFIIRKMKGYQARMRWTEFDRSA